MKYLNQIQIDAQTSSEDYTFDLEFESEDSIGHSGVWVCSEMSEQDLIDIGNSILEALKINSRISKQIRFVITPVDADNG
jgi:hypothetical protein